MPPPSNTGVGVGYAPQTGAADQHRPLVTPSFYSGTDNYAASVDLHHQQHGHGGGAGVLRGEGTGGPGRGDDGDGGGRKTNGATKEWFV